MVGEGKKEAKAEKTEKPEKTDKAEKVSAKTEKSAAGAEKSAASADKGEKGAEKGAEKTVKKKTKRNVAHGLCYIQAGFGNTIITLTDATGGTLAWSTAGRMGFKGSRKGTPFAAQMAAEDAVKRAFENGVRSVNVFVSGPGAGREPAVRALAAAGLKISSLKDVTPVPHNGCRPPKRRRI